MQQIWKGSRVPKHVLPLRLHTKSRKQLAEGCLTISKLLADLKHRPAEHLNLQPGSVLGRVSSISQSRHLKLPEVP